MKAQASILIGRKSLVVEDDEDLRYALKTSLEMAGSDVIDVADGEMANKALQNSAFDLAIVDMVIPNGPGQQILEAAKGHCNTVIAISGDPTLDARDVYSRGAHVLVRKPFALDDVIAAAARHLRNSPQSRLRVPLSTREQDILSLIHKGYESSQISAILGISANTVAHYRKAIRRKHRSMSFIEICSLYYNT